MVVFVGENSEDNDEAEAAIGPIKINASITLISFTGRYWVTFITPQKMISL
jgi:hypothetical protein